MTISTTKKIFSLLALVLFTITSTLAVTTTWTGSSSTVWSNSSNWSNGVPGSNDDVIIPASLSNYPSLTANATIRNFTINGGSLNTNNFNFTVNNNFIMNDGTYFSGTGTITADNFDFNGGWMLIQGDKMNLGNDLTIDGGLLTITGTDFTVDDDLFMYSGYIELDNFDMTVADNWTYQGGTILTPGNLITVDNFILDYGSGVITLPTNIRVLNNMNFSNGGIVVSTNTELLSFGPAATVSGVSSTNYVNGPVRKEITSGGGMTPNFEFPIGDGVVYAPIRISNLANRQNGDYFTASYVNDRHPSAGGTLGSGLDHIGQAEYWILNRANNSATATTEAEVRLSYDETTRSGDVTNSTTLAVVRWNGSQWVNHGRGGGSSNNNTAGVVNSSSRITSFSPFTIGSTSNANPLPVKLLEFNAKPVNTNVQLNWTTTSEINNDYFTIEKSIDGKNWIEIGTVKGAGNAEVLTNYSFNDVNTVTGVQYYKLKQTDVNGEFSYSQIIPVRFGAVINLNVYPVPSNNLVYVNFENDATSSFNLTIFNTVGQAVLNQTGTGNNHQLDITTLENGIYFIEVKTELGISKVKIIKN